MTYDVFISHSSQDRAVAEAACEAIERAGHRCWMAPRDIMPGEDYGEAIVDGIRACRIFLLVVSAQSVASPQVRRETERAANAGAAIIPFRIENVLPSKSLEFFISSAHWLDAIEPPMERHYDYLTKVVGRLLAESDGTTVPPMPMRAIASPGAPAALAAGSAPASAARRIPAKPAIAVAVVAAGALVGAIALWRGPPETDSPATNEIVTNQAAPKGPNSIFTRRATTRDPSKPVIARREPRVDGRILQSIAPDEIFMVAPGSGDWWYAQLRNGEQGYVHSLWIRVIDEEPAAAAAGNAQRPANAVAPSPAAGNRQ